MAHVDVAPQAATEVLHNPVERGHRADDEAAHAEALESVAIREIICKVDLRMECLRRPRRATWTRVAIS